LNLKTQEDRSHSTINNFLRFNYKENIKTVFIGSLKSRLFDSITKSSSNLFLRGKDIISVEPQISGVHEPVITSLIKYFCDNAYNDFLIDIGANIGLTSCQNGNSFKEVHMFEPNPYCCNILEVNSIISLNYTNYEIYKFGLGNENKKALLTVPRHNWGGAFIKDNNNSYNEMVLATKDGFESLVTSNYFDVEIEIRDTATELKPMFEKLIQKNFKKGVIKIDVEGFEPTVLKGIANSIPQELEVLIVFESWSEAFNMTDILQCFSGRAEAYKLIRHTPWKKGWPKLLKVLSLLFNSEFSNTIEFNNSSDWSGDIVLLVKSPIR
jgi:FkbM family methyltransferase